MDNGNNKKALQEAEKVLKRQPDFVCCRALKSLALIRLNRENEALPILDSITNVGTTDEGALQAMNIGYRELQQSEFCSIFFVHLMEFFIWDDADGNMYVCILKLQHTRFAQCMKMLQN